MSTTQRRSSGVRVRAPAGVQVTGEPQPSGGRRGGRAAAPPAAAARSEADLVAEAFETQEIELLDAIELAPTAARRGARAAVPSEPIEFELDLRADEQAVVLIEQDGVYSWRFAEAASGTTRRGVRGTPAQRTVVFRLDMREPGPTTRTSRRGFVSEFFFSRAKAYVLKFVARLAVAGGMRFLERNVRVGLVHVGGVGVAQWQRGPFTAPHPSDRPPRVLLLVHGTFSSTIGSFGGLTATPGGTSFLRRALTDYDTVLGFDHFTLSANPLQNAVQLLDDLQAVHQDQPPQIDVIAYSRGGLVLRSLIEHILPLATWRPTLGRAVFVAATNGGTPLAEPKNWHAMVNLYTNLIVSGCRLAGFLLPGQPVTGLLAESIQGIGAFVKYVSTHVVDEQGVPGLAAMRPDGEFVKTLNLTQPGQPTAAVSQYYAVTSIFQPAAHEAPRQPELPRTLLRHLAGGLTKRLIGEDNDLVVATKAMTCIDPHAGSHFKEVYDCQDCPQVFHTSYFAQEQVARRLSRWLYDHPA